MAIITTTTNSLLPVHACTSFISRVNNDKVARSLRNRFRPAIFEALEGLLDYILIYLDEINNIQILKTSLFHLNQICIQDDKSVIKYCRL